MNKCSGLLIVLLTARVIKGNVPGGARVAGDVILGGLFPVHEKSENTDQSCGEKLYNRGLQRMEAMLYAVDRINADPTLLPDISLGVNILDTCSRDTYALNQSLEFIRSSLNNLDVASEFECARGEKPRYKFNSTGPVLGVVGGSYSSVSLQVANLLRLFRIPQISPASTAKALSDKTRFELFARTVPPDTFQALALVDIVNLFNWTYVSTIASEGSYGESGIEVFQFEASKRNICIAVQEKVPSRADEGKFKDIITNLLVKSARAIILFTRADDARGLLAAAQSLGHEDTFYWIASDGWGKQQQVIADLEEVAAGAITVELESKKIEDFDEYMFGLNPENNTRNPWFRDYWQKLTGCMHRNSSQERAPSGTRFCDKDVSLRNNNAYEQDSKVQFVIDAVYAFAYALQKLKNDLCPNSVGICDQMKAVDGGTFYKNYLLKTSFTDMADSFVKFDEHGDGLARYTIYNYQKNTRGSGYDYKVIGKWNEKLLMNASDVVWGVDPNKLILNQLEDGQTIYLPTSRCSEPCSQGAVKKMTEGETCCWVCNNCLAYEYMENEYTCTDCGVGRWPNNNKSSCFDIEIQYMSWSSVFAILPICLSSLGIVLTLITIIVLVRNRDTPLVRASGRELSYVLLTGILLCFINTFLLLAKPGIASCILQRFGVGLGFAVVYGALLTKTNRIFRIFRLASMSAARPNFVSPRSQLFITFSIVGVQIFATIIWCIVHNPDIRYDYPTRDQVILKCNINDSAFVISQVYSMILITVCTIYAVKTRKVPENFNEAKFIGFTMYTTCIIWLAFVPLYFGTGNSYEIQITTLCITISLSAYVTLICLYSPKLYIIILHPEKNVRKLTMNTVKKPNLASAMPLIPAANAATTSSNQGGYNMVSGKTLYYNSLKNENNKVDTSVTLANGSHATKTALLPRTSINISGEAQVHSKSQPILTGDVQNDENTSMSANLAHTKTNGDVKQTIKSSVSNLTIHKDKTEKTITSVVNHKNALNNNIVRKGSITSECSSSYSNTQNSIDMETPKHLQRFSCALRKSFVLDECNSEISFLSETTRNSTPLNGSPNLRTNSLRFKKENIKSSLPSKDVSVKSNPDLRKSLVLLPPEHFKNCGTPKESDTAHIVTIRNSHYETVPIGLSQDIPDVFL